MNGDTHSFLFADLVGYTALTAAQGDEAAADLAEEFANAARALATEHGAEFVKAMGDAVMVQGPCAAELVLLGLRLAGDASAASWRPPVRAGIHTGPAVARGDDWFGTTVNVASRLAACAGGGELLLTAETGRHVDRAGALELLDRGLRRLRDVPMPVHVFAARPAPADLPLAGVATAA